MKHVILPDSGKRVLAISDIHGYKDGLLRLLQNANYDPSRDQLLLLGDYIDADNAVSWDTLDLVRELTESGAIAIPGNQELKLASLADRSRSRRRRSSLPSKINRYEKWILSLPLYVIHNHILFVHAGIRPEVPLTQQSVRDLTEVRELFFNCPHDKLAALIDQDESNREGTLWRSIMFGHTPTFKLGGDPGQIWSDSRRIGIDTGSKHGYRLTLLDLDGGSTYSCATSPGYQSSDFRIGTAKDRLRLP